MARNGLRDELWSKIMLCAKGATNPSQLALLSLEHASAITESKVGRSTRPPYSDLLRQRLGAHEPGILPTVYEARLRIAVHSFVQPAKLQAKWGIG
jgi:hypothetical protein